MSILDKATIIVKDDQDDNKILAKLNFDGFIPQDAIGKLIDLLNEEVYSFDPVTYEVKLEGTNKY